MKYAFYDDDYESSTVELPHKNVVCWRCRGEGTHDCWEGGMTGDEMAEQGPEFFEDYMSGMYSTRCSVCHGRRVIQVPDRMRCDAGPLRRGRAGVGRLRGRGRRRAAHGLLNPGP